MNRGEKFDEQLERIKLVTKTRTQAGHAEYLGIRQSFVSDAKRRGNIPADWLLTIMRVLNVNPDWVSTGKGMMYLPSNSNRYDDGDIYREKAEMLAALRGLPTRLLADELVRRVVLAETAFSEDD